MDASMIWWKLWAAKEIVLLVRNTAINIDSIEIKDMGLWQKHYGGIAY